MCFKIYVKMTAILLWYDFPNDSFVHPDEDGMNCLSFVIRQNFWLPRKSLSTILHSAEECLN
jgi:hypothetical protein